MPPLTIDNLGSDASNRYAEDQKAFEPGLIREAHAIPVETQIEVTTPGFPSELEALLQAAPTHLVWASFSPPGQYFEQKKRLFTYLLIPSMGSEEKQESQSQKILSMLLSKVEEKGEMDKRGQYLAQQEQEQQEKEKNTLTSLLKTIAVFDKLMIDINSRRGQYQKG